MATMWAYGQSKALGSATLKTPFADRLPSAGIEKLEVEVPEIGPDEVLVKTKAVGLNYNSIWSSLCHPVAPAQLIASYAARNQANRSHVQPYAIFGSDASGVIAKVGKAVAGWKEGDEVVIHCNVADENDPITKVDAVLSESQAIWGYETNFGAFAEYTVVKAMQLLPKPRTVDWAPAASYCLTLSTAYRMLVSENGARLKSGETCLIWGGAGGLGSFAIQLVKLVGGTAVAVVSDDDKGRLCSELGADVVINRKSEGFGGFVLDNGEPNYKSWHHAKAALAKKGVGRIDVVFEHVGRETLPVSLYLAARGGRVVTCAATSGYLANIDIRFLWMQLKTLIGSHIANADEARAASELVAKGNIVPLVHSVQPIDRLPMAMDQMYAGDVTGKLVFLTE